MSKKQTKFVNLEEVLGKDAETLSALSQDTIETEKLGTLPITALDNPEYKAIKKDCMTMVPDGTGGMQPDLDDDQLMVRVLITAVDKDDRTDFSFANKKLLDKLGVATAQAAVDKLLAPGEVYRGATKVQDISGWTEKAAKEREDEVKNS